MQQNGHEALENVALLKPLAVLGEGGSVEGLVAGLHVEKPAEEQVEINLLAQLPFAADRVEHLQQQGANQLLRGNRVAPVLA